MTKPDWQRLVRELIGAGLTPADIERHEFLADLNLQFEQFESSPDHRMIMAVARRINAPFSHVAETWTYDDLVRDMAWDIFQRAKEDERCPACGFDHDELRDPDTNRVLEDSPVKLQLVDCWLNKEKAFAEESLGEDARKAGQRYEVRPRKPGDKFVDRG